MQPIGEGCPPDMRQRIRFRFPSFPAAGSENRQGFRDLPALLLDDVEQILGGAGVRGVLGVRIHGFEVEILGLDLLPGDGPAPLTIGPLRQEPEELVEVGQGERILLADLDTGEVVVPDTLGRAALGEEEQVGLDVTAQFERRMMSQIALTAAFTDCCVASRLPFRSIAYHNQDTEGPGGRV